MPTPRAQFFFTKYNLNTIITPKTLHNISQYHEISTWWSNFPNSLKSFYTLPFYVLRRSSLSVTGDDINHFRLVSVSFKTISTMIPEQPFQVLYHLITFAPWFTAKLTGNSLVNTYQRLTTSPQISFAKEGLLLPEAHASSALHAIYKSTCAIMHKTGFLPIHSCMLANCVLETLTSSWK